jgi:hypothetical protein
MCHLVLHQVQLHNVCQGEQELTKQQAYLVAGMSGWQGTDSAVTQRQSSTSVCLCQAEMCSRLLHVALSGCNIAARLAACQRQAGSGLAFTAG